MDRNVLTFNCPNSSGLGVSCVSGRRVEFNCVSFSSSAMHGFSGDKKQRRSCSGSDMMITRVQWWTWMARNVVPRLIEVRIREGRFPHLRCFHECIRFPSKQKLTKSDVPYQRVQLLLSWECSTEINVDRMVSNLFPASCTMIHG